MESIKKIIFPWMYALPKPEASEQDGGQAQAATSSLGSLLSVIIIVVIGIYAGYLCWNCNHLEDMGLRVIYTGLAFFNAIPYLLYYFVIRYLAGYPCGCCGLAGAGAVASKAARNLPVAPMFE